MFLARETRSAAIFYPMFYVSVMMRFPGVTKVEETKNVSISTTRRTPSLSSILMLS
jgi:hypothetical protein